MEMAKVVSIVVFGVGRFVGGLLLALFCLLLANFVDMYLVTPATKLLASENWIRLSDCEVVDVASAEWPRRDSTEMFQPSVYYRYSLDSKEYLSRRVGFTPGRTWDFSERWMFELDHSVGSEIPCWVNPENPSEAVLIREFSMRYLSGYGLVPLLFCILTGGFALILWFSWILKL